MYLLILPAFSQNIIHIGRKSICVTVSLRTYMLSQLIYLHFGSNYTSFPQLEAVIHALDTVRARSYKVLYFIKGLTFILTCLIFY